MYYPTSPKFDRDRSIIAIVANVPFELQKMAQEGWTW